MKLRLLSVRLNFAENLMFRGSGQAPAIIFKSETDATRTLSWDTLRTEVTGFAGALRAMGIRPGDRVAGFVPNMPEAIILQALHLMLRWFNSVIQVEMR